ncbi:MAG: chromosome segregation protein SMC, partial [Marmoricola sp.]
ASAAQEEVDRLTAARADAIARMQRAERAFTSLETQVAGLDAGEEGLDAEHEGAAAVLRDIDERLAKAREETQGTERQRTALLARQEALELGLTRKDGAGALLAASEPVSGMLGSVAALLSVRAGYEAAVAAALGAAADAVAVEHLDAAVEAIVRLKDQDLGRAGVLTGGAGDEVSGPELPSGLQSAADLVECPDALRPALRGLVSGVAVVADLDEARRVVAQHPQVRAVTRDGDLVGAHFAAGGSASAPTLIEVQAALEETAEQLGAAGHTAQRLAFELNRLEQERHEAQRRVDVAMARLHESDAHLAAVAEELAQHGSQARSAKGEAERLATAIEAAEQARDEAAAGLAGLEQRAVAAAEAGDSDDEDDRRAELGETARAARAAETEARLALRTAEERARALAGRAESLERAARDEQHARARAIAHRERVRREGQVARAVAHGAQVVLERLEGSLATAAQEREQVTVVRRSTEDELMQARGAMRELEGRLGELVDNVHRDEMARTQQRMRLEQLEERALEELGLDAESLVSDYGPHLPVPVLVPDEEGVPQEAEPVPFVREEQAKRLKTAERALAVLGRVNPLALEEFSALEERHRFLTEQLEDLRRTRRDLLDIVKEVDERVEQVFTEAYEDVVKAFDQTFGRLFPGGEGKLVLTDPSDMLTTGVEVEARPAGKKVKRLSLLSGGERSLVAVCFLFALFKARPSPFYILDEVEAALDDTNLGRLLEIYEELRTHSQLMVITHQKRTMEVGDALYGVSMRGDGVSAVISQRLREAESA